MTSKEIPGEDAAEAGTHLEAITPPPPKPPCKFVEGEPEQMARELVRLLREEAKVI
jgi:electron transfer flavoprotein beta subunit